MTMQPPCCAVCRAPIRHGEKFGPNGCHVVHWRCAGGRTQDDERVEELRRELAQAIDNLQHERRQWIREQRTLSDELANYRTEARAEKHLRALADNALAAAAADLARERQARLTDRAEVDILRVLAEQSPTAGEIESATRELSTPVNEEPEDAMAKRFALLELD